MKVNKTPEIKKIVEKCYPDYKGRKFELTAYDPAKVFKCECNYWDGGTRSYWVGYNLVTGESMQIPGQNPILNAYAPSGFLPENIIIVEHRFFCGQDIGIRIHVHPNNMAKLLPAKKEEETNLGRWKDIILGDK